MRIASYAGRLTALVDGGGIDVAEATGGRFTPDAWHHPGFDDAAQEE